MNGKPRFSHQKWWCSILLRKLWWEEPWVPKFESGVWVGKFDILSSKTKVKGEHNLRTKIKNKNKKQKA